MQFARAIHFDESDQNIFFSPARTGEWCLSGGFEFSNWTEQDLSGKARQAFANGWLSLETFGRVTFVAVAQITDTERNNLVRNLAEHFVKIYGAPSIEAAISTAQNEIDQMIDLCDGHDPNTLLTVSRELTDAGVKESFRTIVPQSAGLDQFAIHGEIKD